MFHAALLTEEPDFISISYLADCGVIRSVHPSNARHGLGMPLVFDIHVMFMFAEFEGRQRLFDQMSEIVLNWNELAWEVFVRCRCHYTQSPA